MELSKKDMESLFESMNASNPSKARACRQFIYDNYDFVNRSLRDYSIPSFVAALEEKGIFKTTAIVFRGALKQVRASKGELEKYRKRFNKDSTDIEAVEVEEAV